MLLMHEFKYQKKFYDHFVYMKLLIQLGIPFNIPFV